MSFRTARLKAGLTVKDVQRELGVSDAAIYQWETGIYTPNVSNLLRLATLYNCTVDELLRNDEAS